MRDLGRRGFSANYRPLFQERRCARERRRQGRGRGDPPRRKESAKRYLNIARARNVPDSRSSRGFHVNKFLLTTYTSFETRSDVKPSGDGGGTGNARGSLASGASFLGREQ